MIASLPMGKAVRSWFGSALSCRMEVRSGSMQSEHETGPQAHADIVLEFKHAVDKPILKRRAFLVIADLDDARLTDIDIGQFGLLRSADPFILTFFVS